MDLHIPEQKFTLNEGGFGNVRIEVLSTSVVADEPVNAPAVAEEVAAPTAPAPATVEESEQPAQTTEAMTVDNTLEKAGVPTV